MQCTFVCVCVCMHACVRVCVHMCVCVSVCLSVPLLFLEAIVTSVVLPFACGLNRWNPPRIHDVILYSGKISQSCLPTLQKKIL